MDLKGRSFLTLKDFTKEEIEYLVNLAAELKRKKKEGHAVLLKRQLMIWVWERLIWIPKAPRLEKKRALKILPEFWVEFTMELNTEAMDRNWWKNWQNMQEFRCGTD